MYIESELSESKWWRWPILPFAAIVGAAIATFLIQVLMWLAMKFQGGFSEDGWYFHYIMPLISSAIFGYFYTIISCMDAPRGKVLAGTVMVTVLGLFCLVSVFLAWFTKTVPGAHTLV